MTDPTADPRFMPAVDLIRRTGAAEFAIRHQDDEQPVVWFAVAGYAGLPGLRPKADAKVDRWEVDADLHPLGAVLRLAERLIDGGTCAHCHKPAALNPDTDWTATFLEDTICWRAWDPELATYRRACE